MIIGRLSEDPTADGTVTVPPVSVRVLVIPKWYPTPERPTFGLFCREHARAAARRNDVRVLAFTPEPMSGRRVYRYWDDPAEPLETRRLIYRRPRLRPAAMATQLAGMRAALRDWQRAGWRPDVIHAHVFEAGFPALLLGRRIGCPVVVSEHFTAFQRGLVRGTDRLLAQYCFRSADLVCPVSDSLRRELEAVAPRGRYRVVPNVVDTTVFHPPMTPRRRGAGEPLRLLNVAALAAKKCHADLLDALALLRERAVPTTLDVIGEGELLPELQEQARRLHLGDAVRFLGPRDSAAVADAMRASDLFVLPSRFENLPVVLLEAMASGLPAVATRVGGVPEIIDEDAGLLVAPGDVAGLSEAIESVAERRDEFDATALAERARRRYGIDAVAAVWDEIYDEVVATRRRAPAGRARRGSS
jgi:glycosyltransferase involved in cell wall biosynthesis